MAKINQGQDVVSLFTSSVHQGQLKTANFLALKKQRVVYAIIGAFFIVIFSAMALNFLSQKLESRLVFSASAGEAEKVAFQPGKFITQEIGKGYLKK